ncbi:OmpA family protein [Chitinophaga arvensicola]|uniref:OmpA family protein n=1 Tax=Chitinophaga arvensicola TaxID=29529 RepID=A0A1I0RBJ6_9BACT|nr:OmpA family protein [Chitinophaga arvensicola]SEW38215.1 OmpA family protein [Chitinophaga arvensicola]
MSCTRYLTFFIACLLAFSGIQAQNLIPNPDFTDVNICTERNYPCAPSAWHPVAPSSARFIYTSQKNNRYLSLTMYSEIDPAVRNYCQAQLICPIRKGQQYRLKMNVATNGHEFPTPGVYFDTAMTFTWQAKALEVPASLVFSAADSIDSRNGWITLEKVFTASRDADYIIIGNFDSTLAHYPEKINYYLSLDKLSLTPLSGNNCADAAERLAGMYAIHNRHDYLSPLKHANTRDDILRPVVRTVFYTKGSCDTLLLKGDFYLPKSRDIDPAYIAQMENLLKQTDNYALHKIRVTGYSFLRKDNAKFNEIVAQDKAKAIVSYFVYQRGFSFDDFIITGVGRRSSSQDSTERVEVINCQPAEELTVSVTRTDTLLIPDILFQVNSHRLENTMLQAMDSLIRKIPDSDSVTITVTGHTDNTGTGEYNQELSLRRALTVADYIKRVKPRSQITDKTGMGETMPIADNNTPAGRRKNRRVEIVLYYLTIQ